MTQYVIHSVVRKVDYRTFRAKAPAALRRKQYVGDTQARLVPGTRMLISEETLQRNLLEFRQKTKERIIEVRTTDGRLVDLSTMQPAPAAPVPVLPHPRLDSVKYDRPTGQYIPPYVGDDTSMPQVLPHGEKPELLKQAENAEVLDAAAAVEVQAQDDSEEALEAAIAAAQESTVEDTTPAPSQQKPVSYPSSKKNRR